MSLRRTVIAMAALLAGCHALPVEHRLHVTIVWGAVGSVAGQPVAVLHGAGGSIS